LTFGAGQAHFDLAVEVVLVSGALAVLEGLLGCKVSVKKVKKIVLGELPPRHPLLHASAKKIVSFEELISVGLNLAVR
jgi:hypothetical protein